MIAPETIAAVKQQTDIVALIGESVRLKRQGRSIVGLCPFHQEKTASFHVNAERQYAHCFGCKWGGGAIDFVMAQEGLTFPEAVTALAERAGIAVDDRRTDDERREATAAQQAREDLYRVNAVAATYYERCLCGQQQHQRATVAHEELHRRDLALPDGSNAASTFRLGYAPPEWDGLTTYLRRNGLSLTVAERAGLLVPKQGGGHYDRFRNRLMFPVLDVMGRVVAFSGRALADSFAPPHREPPPKYVNSPESPVYTKGQHLYGLFQARQSIRTTEEAVMVEGNFDVVSLHARGITAAVAPLGTALTIDQAKLVRRFATGVVVLFDGDRAGHKATTQSRETLRDAGLSARVGEMPAGMDPDDFVRTRGADEVRAIVRSARGMLEYLLDKELAPRGFIAAKVEAQSDRIKRVMALLSAERDPMQRALAKTYADRLATSITVGGRPAMDLRALERAVRDALHEDQGQGVAQHDDAATPPRARAVVGALLDAPGLLDDPEVQEAVSAMDDVALVVAAIARHKADPAAIVDAVPAQWRTTVAERLASPLHEEHDVAKRTLLENAVAARNRVLRSEVADAAAKGGRDGLTDAFAALRRRARSR